MNVGWGSYVSTRFPVRSPPVSIKSVCATVSPGTTPFRSTPTQPSRYYFERPSRQGDNAINPLLQHSHVASGFRASFFQVLFFPRDVLCVVITTPPPVREIGKGDRDLVVLIDGEVSAAGVV